MSVDDVAQLASPYFTRMDSFNQYGTPHSLGAVSDEMLDNTPSYSDPQRGTLSYRSDSVAGSLISQSIDYQDDLRLEEIPQDEATLLQACVFIEDAVHYRSIHHRVDEKSLTLYRRYYSRAVQWLLYGVIFIVHALAFIETPSSLTKTSDLRTKGEPTELPCGATEAIECLCLLVFLIDFVAKSYFKGKSLLKKDKWLIAYGFVLVVSFVDWFVSIGMGCPYSIRVRRMLRPFFLIQNSPLMKKTIKSIGRTLPQVASVLLLLFFHLYFFTMFGMLLFPKDVTDSTKGVDDYDEYEKYFKNIIDAFINMLVLLTTANNPDVTLPAYNVNRFYSIFFIVFLVIGLYCLMNMLTAVVYNQFRGYFRHSMQASLFRQRLGIRAAFEVLRRRKVALKLRSPFDAVSEAVPTNHLEATIARTNIPRKQKRVLMYEIQRIPRTMLNCKHFVAIFAALEEDISRQTKPEIRQMTTRVFINLQWVFSHRYFTMFGCFIAAVNVVVITIELATEYEKVRSSSNTYLGIANLVFIPYYMLEQILKVWALGWRRYRWEKGNVFDALVTLALVIVQIIYMAMYGIPYWAKDEVPQRGSVTLWDLVRIINMLILIKLIRVITTQFKAMFIVTSTMYDLIKNLKAFAGVLAIAYYSYALLGMVLFSDKVVYSEDFANVSNIINSTDNSSDVVHECGTFEQLNYWSNNFDDFASSLVVLWNLMVVNNWHVFLNAFSRYTNKWSQLYFIIWWLISVVLALNLFTALILENFIMRWDRAQQVRRERSESTGGMMDSYRTEDLTIHDIFREELEEPSEESLMSEIHQHPYLLLQRRV